MDEYVINLEGAIERYFHGRDYVKYFLGLAGDKPVRLKVNSLGGDVNEALAISNLLAENGKVTVEFIGFNASAATWMAFGASAIEAHEDCLWLAHKSSISVDVYGHLNADEVDATIEELKGLKKSMDAIDLMIAKKYADRSGKTIKDVLEMMSQETWMSAEEAKDMGFIDRIIPGGGKTKIDNSMVNMLKALNMPVPEIKDEDDSIVRRILNGLKSIINTDNSKTNVCMNGDFKFVNEILGVDALEVKDGYVQLKESQLEALNSAIKNAKQEAQSEKDKYGRLVGELNELSDCVKNAEEDKKVEEIKKVFDKIPAVETKQKDGDENKKFADVAVDPVNFYEED